jgi:glycosyltransferase involved in cell wall biosynthesis
MLYVWLNYCYFIKRADHLITVSDYTKDDISLRMRISENKLTTIHHGLDEDYKIDDVTDKTCLSIDQRKFVLMLGGDSHHKNPDGAIASWFRVSKKLREKYPLKIIGFSGSSGSLLMSAIKKYDLNGEVEINGWVSEQELIDHMRSARLFLYLSRFEGFGFPPLHAMASGTPVVSSNCTSIPEVMGDVGMKFSPDDYEMIARGIETMLADDDCWHRQSSAGIKRSEDFSWSLSAAEHMGVYRELLG